MQKLDHQFNFHLEHEKLIFTIPVGSKLIGVENSESDEDFLSIYTHNVIKNPFFVFPIDNEVTSVDYKNSVMQETSSITAAHIISSILNPRSLGSNAISTILSLLAAVKYDCVSVNNQDLFNVFKTFLSVPGNGKMFWQYAAQHVFDVWQYMPTVDNNWSQKFDSENSHHLHCKQEWSNLVHGYYPVVSQKVGYDKKFVAWLLKDLILIKNIVAIDKIINTEESDIIKSVKAEELGLVELQKYKIKLWSEVRKALESPTSTYLLGKGISLEEAKNKNLFGLQGFLNIVNSFEENK